MAKQNTEFNQVESFLTTHPKYELSPWLGLGATDSAHGVFFVSNGNGPIAVKAYKGENAAKRAEHEEKMLQLIKFAGFLTLSPLGIESNRDGRTAFLLTKYIPDLSSMSSVVQNKRGNIAAQVQATATTLGELNGHNISHGDAQIKNFMLPPALLLRTGHKGSVMVIDPEKGGTDRTGHFKNNPYGHDLDSLVQSLAYKGYGGKNPNVAGDIIMEDVVMPYVVAAEAVGSASFDPQQIGAQGIATFLEKHNALYSRPAR